MDLQKKLLVLSRIVVSCCIEKCTSWKKIKFVFFKLIYVLASFLSKKNPKMYYAVLRIFKLIHTYGEKHSDFKKYHGGRIQDESMSILKLYNKKFHVSALIHSFTHDKIKLSNGEMIESDYVIFCTGSGGHRSLIPIFVDNKNFFIKFCPRSVSITCDPRNTCINLHSVQ